MVVQTLIMKIDIEINIKKVLIKQNTKTTKAPKTPKEHQALKSNTM